MAMMRRGGEEQFASMAGRGWRYPGDSEHRKGKGVAAFGHLADSPCSLLEYRLEARFYNYMQGRIFLNLSWKANPDDLKDFATAKGLEDSNL
jgi:hypothetical protein